MFVARGGGGKGGGRPTQGIGYVQSQLLDLYIEYKIRIPHSISSTLIFDLKYHIDNFILTD